MQKHSGDSEVLSTKNSPLPSSHKIQFLLIVLQRQLIIKEVKNHNKPRLVMTTHHVFISNYSYML